MKGSEIQMEKRIVSTNGKNIRDSGNNKPQPTTTGIKTTPPPKASK